MQLRLVSRFAPGLALVAALTLTACGSEESEQAQIRLLNVSTGYESLDLYVDNNDDDDDNDTKQISAVAYGSVSDYASLDSDTYTVKVKRANATSTLETLSSEKLTDESHATYVGYGSSGHYATLKIAEDVTAPDANDTKLTLLNVAEAGSLDVYLTDEDTILDDASPQFGTVASGSSTSTTTIDSGTYRLRVTGAGDTTDVRLDVSSIELKSTQVVTLILTATQGGSLVNAILLPQQGSITEYPNTQARVRGAVGIANGTLVTLKIGGVSLLSNTTVGVIGNKYQQVDAGAAAVVLSVDGTLVSVADQTLTAGADYTFLVYSDANGTQTTLISDDNRLPTTSGQTKIRLLNGLSSNGAALTLYIDSSPIIEGQVLGQASDYVEVDAGEDFQLDITETNTATPVLSRTGVTLLTGGVYTMFAAGVNGTVRKDR